MFDELLEEAEDDAAPEFERGDRSLFSLKRSAKRSDAVVDRLIQLIANNRANLYRVSRDPVFKRSTGLKRKKRVMVKEPLRNVAARELSFRRIPKQKPSRSTGQGAGPAYRAKKGLEITKAKKGKKVTFVGEFDEGRVRGAIDRYGLTKCSGKKYSSEGLVDAIAKKLRAKGRAVAS